MNWVSADCGHEDHTTFKRSCKLPVKGHYRPHFGTMHRWNHSIGWLVYHSKRDAIFRHSISCLGRVDLSGANVYAGRNWIMKRNYIYSIQQSVSIFGSKSALRGPDNSKSDSVKTRSEYYRPCNRHFMRSTVCRCATKAVRNYEIAKSRVLHFPISRIGRRIWYLSQAQEPRVSCTNELFLDADKLYFGEKKKGAFGGMLQYTRHGNIENHAWF